MMVREAGAPNVVVVTQIVTPYQTELFDAVHGSGTIDLRVIYLCETAAFREWLPHELHHRYCDLSAPEPGSAARALEWLGSADLCVFGNYRHPEAHRWIETRANSGKPWCFWGERPGFRMRGAIGKYYRQWKLAKLKHSAAPIWGIGNWAVDGYRREFGKARQYYDVPYFSDLERFCSPGREASRGAAGAVRLLFSGELITRKGVDLLAQAFAGLAATHRQAQLDIIGDGPMRNRMMRILAPVSANVSFHGFQQWRDLPEFYARADLLCVPSRYDGWGLVVPEGLAAGLPVLATDQMGAALELVRDGVNGWLVEAGSLEGLRRGMERAISLPGQERERMSAAAVESVARHGLAHGVRRFEDAVAGTLGGWKGAPSRG